MEDGDGREAEKATKDLEKFRQKPAATVIKALKEEFERVFTAWKERSRIIKWKEQKTMKKPGSKDTEMVWVMKTTNIKVPAKGRPTWRQLWEVDMGVIMREIKEEDKQGTLFGYLPKMAMASKGCIGALMASSFCERINSQANLILTEGNTWLSDEEMEKLVVLRMNRKFMSFMRKYYPNAVGEAVPSMGTLLTEEQNEEVQEVQVMESMEIDI